MSEIKSWDEYRKAQRIMLAYAGLAILASAFFFYQGGIGAGVIFVLVSLLFAGMGIFPRTSKEHPIVRRWIIGFTIVLFGVTMVLGYFA